MLCCQFMSIYIIIMKSCNNVKFNSLGKYNFRYYYYSNISSIILSSSSIAYALYSKNKPFSPKSRRVLQVDKNKIKYRQMALQPHVFSLPVPLFISFPPPHFITLPPPTSSHFLHPTSSHFLHPHFPIEH